MNKKISIAITTLFVLSGGIANAQTADTLITGITNNDSAVSSPKLPLLNTPSAPALRPEIRDFRQENNGARKDIRDEAMKAKNEIRNQKIDNRVDAKDLRKETGDKIKILHASTTEVRATIKDEAQATRLEIAKKQASLVGKRLDSAVDRVQKLSDRVSIALNNLDTKGIDVSLSRARISASKIKLDEARAKVVIVKTSIEASFSSQNLKESLMTTNSLVKDASKSIQDAHDNVAKAISLVKPGQNKPLPATTSTTTTQ